MSDKNELFPFPPAPPGGEDPASPSAGPLPPFPTFVTSAPPSPHAPEAPVPFSDDEVRDLRQVVSLLREGKLGGGTTAMGSTSPGPTAVLAPPPLAPLPVSPAPEADLKKSILDFFAGLAGCQPQENEAKQALLQQLRGIGDPTLLLAVVTHLAGVVPLRDCLRHGTPDQKLFTAIALGDRFLQGMSGLAFPQRQSILKTVATLLADVSESTTFLAMEGEPFNPQYHERIPGASASGRVIREMRGYLVIRKASNQVMRLGRVWT